MNKKAQEEMVGLVAIMLVVAVIFLVFLGIFARQDNSESASSTEVSQFLDAALKYTTECTKDGYFYKDLQGLIRECKKGTSCNNGEQACDMLERLMGELVESGWTFSPESPKKGYEIILDFESISGTPIQPFTPIIGSDYCSTNKIRGDDRTIPSPDGGSITLILNLCVN